jgi:hypothetical protein
MSSLVKSSGSWAIALANARTSDGTTFAQLTEESVLNIIIQGIEPNQSSIFSTLVSDAQPLPELTLGDTPPPKTTDQESVESGTLAGGGDELESLTGLLDEIANEEETVDLDQPAEQSILDLSLTEESEQPTVTASPLIKGVAAPGVAVTVEINSETQIVQTLVADENGEFSLDLASLGRQLEPGEHTVTYSYTDPATNQPITKTQTFLVSDTGNQLAQADTGASFGSGDPFPVETTPTPTPEATSTPESTRSAVVSTDSGSLLAGSVENTIALVVGGLFFIFAGAWSWWLAHEVRES